MSSGILPVPKVNDFACRHTHTHTLSLSPTPHTHTHTHTHSLSHTHTLSLSHTHTHTHTLTLSLSLAHTHTHTHSCQSCGCDPAGAVAGSECDPTSGECLCKMYVTGDTCNTCINGFQLLDANNPFGCSAGNHDNGVGGCKVGVGGCKVGVRWV